MRVLHLAAGNRWTGAAAPAFAETEALRSAGIEAHYAYTGGYKLEAKIGHLPFTHAVIEKAQNPAAFFRTAAAIDKLIDEFQFDIVHAHLTYDHWLAEAAVRRRPQFTIARTFHAPRVLRRDPFTRYLIDGAHPVCVVNDALRNSRALARVEAHFTPPPIDHRQFSPDGPSARSLHGIESGETIVTTIGKLAPGRGFEDVLATFAAMRRSRAMRLMIIGHGDHRPALEQHARDLGVDRHIVWAGYHEDDLAAHYRASDVLLFTAAGSDYGHRAILEAMATGLLPAVFPLDGVAALLGSLGSPLIAGAADPEALALTALGVLERNASLRAAVVAESQRFSYERSARRLVDSYSGSGGGRRAKRR